MNTNRLYIFYGCIISLAALAILFAIRLYRPELLDIDAKWLIVAGVPILVTLIIGRFITGFKGFGVEIAVAAAQQPLADNPLIIDFVETIKTRKKEDAKGLNKLPKDQLRSYRTLSFRIGLNNNYEPGAITDYLDKLPNVDFFEITDTEGKFIALIKIDRGDFQNDPDFIFRQNFIDYLAKNDLHNLPLNLTTQRIYPSTTVIQAFDMLRSSGKDVLPVLDNPQNARLIGIVTERKLEKYLANAVLRSMKENK